MNWNELFEQFGATWGSWSAVILLTLKMSILDPITTRKTQFDLSTFKTLQTSVKDEIKAYTKIMVDGFDDFKKQTVAPLLEELKKKDYQQAIANDIIISLLANTNVPLANKEQSFRELSKLDSMNKELVNKILVNIETQKKAVSVEVEQTKETYDKLKEV